jgi:glutaminyl-tRNA synthetase
MSKRYLRKLVEEGLVDGWDDPRMPTLCGLRRRGYTPASIFDFVSRAGVAKAYSVVDYELLEHCIREELNDTAKRRIAIMHPIKVVLTNYPEDKVEYFDLPNNPQHPELGTRSVPFTRELYIDADDFAEVPPPKFFRMKPDGEVRLMGAYIVKCNEIIKNDDGSIKEIRCTADIETGNGMPTDGRKVKGTIHWLSAPHAETTTVKLYDFLFDIENVDDIPEGKTFDDYLNKNSVTTIENAMIEPALVNAEADERFQFVRCGYFVKDSKNENTFNRIVGLKDSFPKQK